MKTRGQKRDLRASALYISEECMTDEQRRHSREQVGRIVRMKYESSFGKDECGVEQKDYQELCAKTLISPSFPNTAFAVKTFSF